MDKVTAQAGRYFRYDIKQDKSYLSTIVTSKRQCVSLINYDSWKSDFDLANEAVRTKWNNYQYYKATYDNINNYESDYDKKATEKVCQVCFDLLDEYIKIFEEERELQIFIVLDLVFIFKNIPILLSRTIFNIRYCQRILSQIYN